MIEIYIRHLSEAEGILFNTVDTISEVKETIDFIQKTRIFNCEGIEYVYDGHIIEMREKEIKVEILVE